MSADLQDFRDDQKQTLAGGEWAICIATFYDELATKLVNGAIVGFDHGGVSGASIQTFEVPGAFELPLAAKLCAESGDFAGIACLGAVIRGETDHYDFVCAEAARGIQDVALRTGVPCAFGVITCDDMDQALARAGGTERDQGFHAAITVMRMSLMGDSVA